LAAAGRGLSAEDLCAQSRGPFESQKLQKGDVYEMNRSIQLFAAAAVLSLGCNSLVVAQNDAVRGIYESSANIATNMDGVHGFAAPPASFDPLTASDEALATYGFPPHPDKSAEPAAYAQWAHAVTTAKKRWNGTLRARPFHNTPMKTAKSPAGFSAPSGSNTPSVGNSYNWSGAVNTNTVTKYGLSSVYYVFSEFNVPVAQQAFNGSGGTICDGGWDITAIWNGIDGFSGAGGGDVLQGGVDSAYYCAGSTKGPFYSSWIEWFPAGSIYEFGVNPGDDIYVETWSTSSTQGYVYIADLTTQISATYGLTAPSGTQLVGNSAEFIVERPCCRGSNLYPLANYVGNFWSYSGDYNFRHVLSFPGSTAPTTWLLGMLDDAGDQVISVPNGVTNWDLKQGLTPAGLGGKYSIFFQDQNCAHDGGCTP